MSSLAPSIVEMNNAAYMAAIANQRERIASLEAERDQLRAEVERLRKPLTDDPLQVAAALRRLVVSHAHEFGDTFYFGHVASALELCPACHGVALTMTSKSAAHVTAQASAPSKQQRRPSPEALRA